MTAPASRRFRFEPFVLSPAHRLLLRQGHPVPLIPRYFDLLVLLLEERHRVLGRQEIFDRVWSDVVVSDGALSQAVRTLRRALDEERGTASRIRTVARHGYQFVGGDVEIIEDSNPLPSQGPMATFSTAIDPFEEPLRVILGAGSGAFTETERAAAERLHELGTTESLRRIAGSPGEIRARALLRETRWAIAGAGPVPLLAVPGRGRIAWLVTQARWRDARRDMARRWAAASAGGALAGLLGGLLGGVALRWQDGPLVPLTLPVALAVIGALIGGLGAAGVGAGLAGAEPVSRSRRGWALVLGGALGGGTVGALVHLVALWTLADLFGRDVSTIAGGVEGILLGAAAGLGYAVSTPRPRGGGLATPRGARRLRAALLTGLCCALAAAGLALADRRLSGTSLELLARSFQNSRLHLAALARLFGEAEVGMITRVTLGAYEGLLFGFGLALGLTHRPAATPVVYSAVPEQAPIARS